MNIATKPKFIGIFRPDENDDPWVEITDRRSPSFGQKIRVRFFENPMIQAIMNGSYLEFFIDEENQAICAKLNWRENFRRLPFDTVVFLLRIIIMNALVLVPTHLLILIFIKIDFASMLFLILPIYWLAVWGWYQRNDFIFFDIWRWMWGSPYWKNFCKIGYAAAALICAQILLLRLI